MASRFRGPALDWLVHQSADLPLLLTRSGPSARNAGEAIQHRHVLRQDQRERDRSFQPMTPKRPQDALVKGPRLRGTPQKLYAAPDLLQEVIFGQPYLLAVILRNILKFSRCPSLPE